MLECRRELPLVVDLDRTLLKADILQETFLEHLRTRPSAALSLPAILLSRGRARFQYLATGSASLDVETWPVREDLVQMLQDEASAGRKIVVATSADAHVADAVVARFPFFSQVITSDGVTNGTGEEKARRIRETFPNGFIYVGSAGADHAVWRAATGAVVVGAFRSLQQQAREFGPPLRQFASQTGSLEALRRMLRLHQWVKNALIFIPLVLGGKVGSVEAWLAAGLGFLALGLVASAGYILNDLWDLPSDRRHWSKRLRPLASGEIGIMHGLGISLVLLAAGFAAALPLGAPSVAVLGLYLTMTLLYSFSLKRVPILDVGLLALLFTIRLGMGIAVTGVRLSPWLLVFSMFMFLSLSLAKRHTEVLRMAERGLESVHGRGYESVDAPLTLGLGLASMQGAILIFVLYLIEDAFPQGFYAQPDILWFSPVILFLFLGSIWLLCQRGLLKDDPVAFALKDKASLLLGGLLGLVVFAAMVGVPI